MFGGPRCGKTVTHCESQIHQTHRSAEDALPISEPRYFAHALLRCPRPPQPSQFARVAASFRGGEAAMLGTESDAEIDHLRSRLPACCIVSVFRGHIDPQRLRFLPDLLCEQAMSAALAIKHDIEKLTFDVAIFCPARPGRAEEHPVISGNSLVNLGKDSVPMTGQQPATATRAEASLA